MSDSPAALRPRRDLSIDQQHALTTAATRLERDFGGSFGVATIERFLHTSYDQFAGRATVPNFLPLLAERFARQRLHALARVEGKISDGKPTVLFLCTHNAGRSQMALGFFTHLAGDSAVAWSGGSEPGDHINPSAVAAMTEVGIDITGEFPKPWTDEIVQAADVVITMGCGDACPIFPASATRTGSCPTLPARTSMRCAPSVTTSKNVSGAYSPTSTSPPDRAEPMTELTTPSVLFVCVKNGGKSQMAAGLMRQLAGDTVIVHSAGTKPGSSINDLSAQALLEVGVDITAETPKPVDYELARDVDVVVTLGREAQLDPLPGMRVENWDTDEPSERGIDGIERMRLVRDDIAVRVRQLHATLTRAPGSEHGTRGLPYGDVATASNAPAAAMAPSATNMAA
ncbi:hypothetical protein MMUR_66300 [Mycolicibacterium murale]|uniref:Phosphotyrosine protein phosphatase I domain-containing protein n=1 Tax=Mycolicibacterium murale TaxID=182220 RepID=A0A7I9WXQ0_9MYCO|nr:hypothetical protein MMUR_66300 [Mycolicibacterium murale]